MALLNPNQEIKRLRTREDKLADKVTTFAGSMDFVRIHTVWFAIWIIINLGALGAGAIFDKFPFGLLTLIVSLEAIFLSTFVMISQNRQANASEIRSELDYHVNVKAEKEIDLIMRALERVSKKQGIDIKDLVSEFQTVTRSTAKKPKNK